MIGDLNSGRIEYRDAHEKAILKNLTNFHLTGIIFLKSLSSNLVASVSHDNTINIWNRQSWSSMQVFKGHRNVISLDQIDDDTMVSGSYDDTTRLILWKISTGDTLKLINVDEWVNFVGVLSNGLIACALASSAQNLRIYNHATESLVNTLDGRLFACYLYGNTKRGVFDVGR